MHSDTVEAVRMRRSDGAPFALAGLWEHWHRDDKWIESCTIVVTEANAAMASKRGSVDSKSCSRRARIRRSMIIEQLSSRSHSRNEALLWGAPPSFSANAGGRVDELGMDESNGALIAPQIPVKVRPLILKEYLALHNGPGFGAIVLESSRRTGGA